MVILRNSLWLFFAFLPQVAQACPACLTSDKGEFLHQRILLLGIMGLLPILVAAAVTFKIYQICNFDSQKMTKGSDQ